MFINITYLHGINNGHAFNPLKSMTRYLVMSVVNISLAYPITDISTYWKVFHSPLWEFIWWLAVALKDEGLIPTWGKIFLLIITHWSNCGVQLISCPVCTGGSLPWKKHSEAGRVWDFFHALCPLFQCVSRSCILLNGTSVHSQSSFYFGSHLLFHLWSIFMHVGLTHHIIPRLGFMGMNYKKDTYTCPTFMSPKTMCSVTGKA